MKAFLGIELGSTRIKAVSVGEDFSVLSSGDYTWKSTYENGIWTYSMDEVWKGLRSAVSGIENPSSVEAMGISGMMHGYLAFDEDWNLLTAFRTWQNTITGEAASKLSELFDFNIPQRWSIAHLYRAILNDEPHIKKLAHITTLAGYVHYKLTGRNVLGIGEASGMFPVDSESKGFDETMLARFDALSVLPKPLKAYLPEVLTAGQSAGSLTEAGSELLGGVLPAGISLAPPEGDAGTGMTATNAVAPRTGNVSAGTSIFSMIVLEKPLKGRYSEIDVVATPEGKSVAMVHCNNCTEDMNLWAELFGECAALFGAYPDRSELFTKLYRKSLEGKADCGGVLVCNYLAGEGVTGFDRGVPLVMRAPGASFGLADFLRAQLYSSLATLRIGMDILASENVEIDSISGHGGLFKTPVVGQKYLAAACKAPISLWETAGEGGPYGMAILSAYMCLKEEGESLGSFLKNKVFAGAKCVSLCPDKEDEEGFSAYLESFKKGLEVEKTAVNAL